MEMYLLSGKVGNKRLWVLLIAMPLCVILHAQDIHFSQYFNSPLSVNPSLAGEGEGRGRLLVNYRSQWNSVTSNPYKTAAISFDRSIQKENIFAGIEVFNDKAGDSNLGTTQIDLSLASKVRVTESDYLKVGLMGAWAQRFVNTTNLTWNSQFDGTTINPTINSGETMNEKNTSYFDCSTGILWTHLFTNNKLNAGLSAFHVIRPSYQLLSGLERTNIRWAGHADLSMVITPDYLMLYPSVLVMMQGAIKEYNLGLMAKFTMGINSKYTGYHKESHLLLGTYYRNNDAIILYTGFDYRNQLLMGISYDINVSKLMGASSARGGMEVSMKYTIPEKNMIRLK